MAGEVPRIVCPHCRQPLNEIGWNTNPEAGLVTFFHNSPGCMNVLGCQLLALPERPRIELVPNLPHGSH